MGREVRKVPKDWEHPKDERGRFIPMREGSYESAAREWTANFLRWEAGEHPSRANVVGIARYFFEYEPPPVEYGQRGCPMFEHDRDDLTHIMLYENTSEGTPLSPAFERIEDLCEWAATHATTFASFTATAEEWRQMLDAGFVHATDPRLPGVIFT